jgi:ribonuclease E
MSFTATLSGHVTADNTQAGNDKARLVEQAISDAINAIVEEANAEGIVIHTTTFSGEWVQDVQTPAATAAAADAAAALAPPVEAAPVEEAPVEAAPVEEAPVEAAPEVTA